MVKRNVAQAQTELSALLDQAHAGEEFVVCKAGVPWARIIAPTAREPRRPGAWQGLLSEPTLDALEAPLADDEIDAWYA